MMKTTATTTTKTEMTTTTKYLCRKLFLRLLWVILKVVGGKGGPIHL